MIGVGDLSFTYFFKYNAGKVGIPRQLVITKDPSSIPYEVTKAGLSLPLGIELNFLGSFSCYWKEGVWGMNRIIASCLNFKNLFHLLLQYATCNVSNAYLGRVGYFTRRI